MNYFLVLIPVFMTTIQDTVMLRLSNQKVKVSLYTNFESWNTAEYHCDKTGGWLYVADSIERSKVIEKLRTVWNDDGNIWIGLHYPSSGQNGVYGWPNCRWLSDYNKWEPDQPINIETRRCVKDTITGWKSGRCYDGEHRFLCETDMGDACTFYERTGYPNQTSEFISLPTTTANKSACENKCLNDIHTNKNCWGANFISNISSSNCILYFADDPYYLKDTATYDTSGTSMLIKDCYLDEKTYGYVDDEFEYDDNTVPSTSCTGYTEVTTTTSPTTSTSSSTTTVPTTIATTPTTAPNITTTTTSTSTPITTSPTSITPTTTSSTVTTPTTSTPMTTWPTTTSLGITTSASISTHFLDLTTSTTCNCNCVNISKLFVNYTVDPDWANMTTEEKVEKLVTTLKVDKTQLSSFARKKTSARDDRVAAKSVGYLGIVLLVLVFGLILLSDGFNLVAYMFELKDAIRDVKNH